VKSLYDMVSPLDFRYYGDDAEAFDRLSPYVSEEAFIKYQAKVEGALVNAFHDLGWCSREVARQAVEACNAVTAEEVYQEEKKTQHVVRALVNCIARKAGPEVRRFVHLFATSADVTDTAIALRFQDLVRDVILPDIIDLQAKLIQLARQHADTPQIGRTHGQHAVPITFGFAMALYVDRLGSRIEQLESARQNLCGQLSGAVGAYNALSLQLPKSAVLFEKLVLSYLGLQPSPGSISSQIVQPEYLTDLGYAAQSCFAVLGNLADDMRHLHRSEIGEVQEVSTKDAVGSSTMPHKVNPKSFENVKSLWKAYAPRMVTMLMDQICEHQRDLTNSASQRFLPELFVALDYCTLRLARSMDALKVNKEALAKNLAASGDQIIAEPLYVLLALADYSAAYDKVRVLAREAREQGEALIDLAERDPEVGPVLKKLDPKLCEILRDPSKYTGQASERTMAVCARRERESATLLAYLKQEKEVLKRIEVGRFQGLRGQIEAVEKGETILPTDFCPSEDRRAFIRGLIEAEETERKQPEAKSRMMVEKATL